MISIDVTKKNGAVIGVDADGILELAVNNEGTVLRTLPQRYFPISSMGLSDISPIIVSDKIILILETVCETLPSPYQYGHFEFVLTYNADFVSDGALEADALYKFESYKNDGWLLESTNIYTFPETGYTASNATSKLNVKMIAWNLDIDLTKTLYFFSRVRGATLSVTTLTLSDVYGSWSGRRLFLYASTFSNTGEDRYCPLSVDLLPRISSYFGSWPSSKSVHYEVYVGESGTLTDYTSGAVDPLVFRDSSLNPTGFYFFDGVETKTFDAVGVPSANYGNKMFFVTPPVDTKKALFTIYRAKWAGGSTGWIAKATEPQDVVVRAPRSFTPSSRLQIPANTFPSNYHLHVIIGTSPVLSDYFLGGDTEDFSKILLAYPKLVDYSTTTDVLDRPKFEYYKSGKITNPNFSGFDYNMLTDISYLSSQNYEGDDKLFIFFRAEYTVWSSSSSSSRSCSSSSCSCLSSSCLSSSCSCSSSSCLSSSCSCSSCSCSCSSSSNPSHSSSCSCSCSSCSSSSSDRLPPDYCLGTNCYQIVCGTGATEEEAIAVCAYNGGCSEDSCDMSTVWFDGTVWTVTCCSHTGFSMCVRIYVGMSCENLSPVGHFCTYISSQEVYDRLHFGECLLIDGGFYRKHVIEGYDVRGDCLTCWV